LGAAPHPRELKPARGSPLSTLYGRLTMLLTGDVQWEAKELLLASGQPLQSLILKVPHHGADNSFGHPAEVTLKKLEEIPTYRTDRHGSIEVWSDGLSYWLRAES
jgi:beta-lactamase superfamily II metal-dependent hydrolase